MLLGWITGPVELRSNSEGPSEEEEAVIDAYFFDLDERIHDVRERIEADLSWAEAEGPQSEAERLRSKLARLSEIEKLAYNYRCAIHDELNKGEASNLRIDRKLSNPDVTYITMTSLNQWSADSYGASFLTGLRNANAFASVNAIQDNEAKVAPGTRMREQEEAILEEIKKLGHDPKLLPKFKAGKAGIKAKVRVLLKESPLFQGGTVYEKAWERLMKFGDIAYGSTLSSP